MNVVYGSIVKNTLLSASESVTDREIYGEPFLHIAESSPIIPALLKVIEKPIIVLRFDQWCTLSDSSALRMEVPEANLLIPLYETLHFVYGEKMYIALHRAYREQKDSVETPYYGLFVVDLLGCTNEQSCISVADSIQHKKKIIRKGSVMSTGEIADAIWKIRNLVY